MHWVDETDASRDIEDCTLRRVMALTITNSNDLDVGVDVGVGVVWHGMM